MNYFIRVRFRLLSLRPRLHSVFVCLASLFFFAGPMTATAQEALASSTSTLGLAPPAEAVVLFDGSNFDAWKPFSFQWINPNDDQKKVQWKLVDGEAMQISFEFEGKRRKQLSTTTSNCRYGGTSTPLSLRNRSRPSFYRSMAPL